VGFESRYWNHSFVIQRMDGRPETFSFVHKKTLFIGLNIVGGSVHDPSEWKTRLTSEVEWTKSLILNYNASSTDVGRVIIFGHANPVIAHNAFFLPLQEFIKNKLQNGIPILYLNGDKHVWNYQPDFLNQTSLLRITLTGGSKEPPLKLIVKADGNQIKPMAAFKHDRQLPV
jgi:hypothetical protein